MTIALSILFLVGLFLFALVMSNGLPETMRATALWLVAKANRTEKWRHERDCKTRKALTAEVTGVPIVATKPEGKIQAGAGSDFDGH